MHNCVILAGSNIEDRIKFIDLSLKLFEKKCGKTQKLSSVYETEPWGYESQNWFLNQAWLAKTDLSPGSLLKEVLAIEKEVGRTRNDCKSYSDRVIDLDIIFYEDFIIESKELVIPHPSLSKRKFVLIPLNEIIPEFQHPVYKKSVKDLLKNCEDNTRVKKVSSKVLQ